jgi:hypothetical protein
LAHILVPNFDDIPIADFTNRYQQRFWAMCIALALTETAKVLVEALIEVQLTESHLINAQQALDADDDRHDRAILARLKTDGLDGAGEALFPNLDQLYDLLERAQREPDA